MQQPTPEWTPAMQTLWNRAMLLARTRGAYGVGFPVPGTNYTPPQSSTMLHDILFVCTATEEEYEAHLAAVRADMEEWKAHVRASGNKRRESLVRDVNVSAIDLSKVEFRL